ncbi:MAG: ABC transporter permease [Acutalibacteraceae bacterium]
MLFFATTIDGLQMGLCFAVLALGVYISYSILDFPDLSVDGTFPLGGVVCTILMLKLGIPALPAILLSFFAGLAAGAVTGVLHVKFNISKLLSGIIVMTALLSVTLSLTKLLTRTGLTTTIFSFRSENLTGIFSGKTAGLLGAANRDYMILIIELVFVIAVKIIIDLFLKTKLGYMLRATGDNEMLVVSLGKDSGTYKILGIALANGFVSMSGALYANLFSQYDNSCGSGKVVMALASVIIGMAVFSKIRFISDTVAVIFGAVVYSLCLNYLVLVDTNGIYLKLLNAVMFAIILIFNDKTSSFVSRRSKLKGGNAKC